MHFDVSELRDLEGDLKKGAAGVTGRATQVVRKVALDIERDAKIAAPVDTGNLEGSIGSEIDGLSAEVGPTAEYGGYVEYGTSKMSAQPYMGPAFEKNMPAFVDALGQVGAKIL